MFEIFIPTEIPSLLILQTIEPTLLAVLSGEFGVKTASFESRFFRGVHITSDSVELSELQAICIVCNGAFGEQYFVDYDWANTPLVTLGRRLGRPDAIRGDMEGIVRDFTEIVETLYSSTLLTRTKREAILAKIHRSFFLLSGIAFSIAELLRKTREIRSELSRIAHSDSPIEYTGNSTLLAESLTTREAELSASLGRLEDRVSAFILTTKKFIIP